MKSYSIGIDVRLSITECSSHWKKFIQNGFCLSGSCSGYCSADREVWPSIFHTLQRFNPKWFESEFDLWFWQVLGRFTKLKYLELIEVYNHVPILLEIFPDEFLGQPFTIEHQILPEQQMIQEHRLRLLGYDLLDISMISPLFNLRGGEHFSHGGVLCYSDSEIKIVQKYSSDLKSVFEDKLNKFHLFDSYIDCQYFRDFANKHMTGHAPYFTVKISELRS